MTRVRTSKRGHGVSPVTLTRARSCRRPPTERQKQPCHKECVSPGSSRRHQKLLWSNGLRGEVQEDSSTQFINTFSDNILTRIDAKYFTLDDAKHNTHVLEYLYNDLNFYLMPWHYYSNNIVWNGEEFTWSWKHQELNRNYI